MGKVMLCTGDLFHTYLFLESLGPLECSFLASKMGYQIGGVYVILLKHLSLSLIHQFLNTADHLEHWVFALGEG